MKTKDYIEQIKNKTGLNNYQIAKQYNINQSNFNKYANGSAQLSVNHAFLIANILKISPSEVLINTRIEKAKTTKNKNELEFWQKQGDFNKNDTNANNIVISQFNPIVGNIKGNTEKIISTINKNTSADIIIFPELAICGYPPEDLLLHNGFIEEVEKHLNIIKSYSYNSIIIIGAPTKQGNKLYNSAIVFESGRKYGEYHKQNLPNYGVFDEKRYFTPGNPNTPLILPFNNKLYSVVICEDTWSQSIINYNKNIGIDTIISLNASPFSHNKYEKKIQIFTKLFDKDINLIYVNLVSSQDSLVFDGGSFVMQDGKITHQLDFFTETTSNIEENNLIPYNKLSYNYNALTFGIKEYFYKSNCFNKILIALSGGIDSALTLSLATDAIGAESIIAVMMPHIYTSSDSINDAKTQAELLGVEYREINISPIVNAFNAQNIATNGIAMENIQARIRGSIIMSIANEVNGLVLNTSNKSESAVGYTTLYGDMVGGFAPIKDVYKTDIYKLVNYRNSISYGIPESIINKEPSAELNYNQKDSDSLPPYHILDEILKLFIDKYYNKDQIVAKGFDMVTVEKVINLVKNSEYKRYQSALGVKFSDNAFDKERRYPIINNFSF